MHRMIDVKRLKWWHHALDCIMWPLMHIATGTLFIPRLGKPQRSHRWHVQKLTGVDFQKLKPHLGKMITCPGDPKAGSRYVWKYVPRSHIPWLPKGWRTFVVLEPSNYNDWWYVGWIADGQLAVNRIPLLGPVRMLIGPGEVTFFAINARSGAPKYLQCVGYGRLWQKRFAKIPLQ